MPQQLASKEQSLFRQVVKNFESKQYKKGLKAAEQILRKSPNHGDTEAMKALLLNSTGKGEEAFALAKVALTHDIKSHVCWHVYGLLWRDAKNFEEAIKAYKTALKLEPESVQIQRDLAFLQIQMRDYNGYVQSRSNMVQARPQLRQNWTALAVAQHLAGDLKAAERTLVTYEDTIKTTPPKTDVEHAEAVLYKNTIIAEMGETERALEHLDAIMKNNLDKTAMMEMRAKYLLALDRKTEAEKAYRDLLARNAEYRAYYDGLEKSMGLDRTNIAELKELYGSYAQNHDRIDAATRIPLDFLSGDEFRAAADQYLRYMLTKGVPSTFNNIKALYDDEAKRQTVQDLVESYSAAGVSNGTTQTEADGEKDGRFEEAVLYFLAQHYNYKLSRNLKKSMELTEKLIEKYPKRYDYQMMKARILKHQGNPVEAAKVMEGARATDIKDRYINTKCAKYQLRNDENDAALSTMSKFTKNDSVGGTLGDLIEMQVLWYLTEDGEAYFRRNMLGLALKRFHTVFDIFELWQQDQFDFHSFSFRKGQIRAYVDMIRWEDRLREHPFYTRAALQAVRVYLSLYDHPPYDMSNGVNGVDDSEKKKAMKKAKKEQERLDAERIEADKKAAAKKSNATSDAETKKPDLDPRGTKLLETKEPLLDAMKFLNPLLEFGSQNLEAQHLGFEIFIRRRKYLLALKCLLAAFDINPSGPTAHEQTIRLFQSLNAASQSTPLDPLLTDLMATNLPAPYAALDASKSAPATLLDLATKIRDLDPKSPTSIYASSLALQRLEPHSQPKNVDAVVKSLDLAEAQDLDLETAVRGIGVLKQIFENGSKDGEKEALQRYVKRAVQIWPGAEVRFARVAGLEG